MEVAHAPHAALAHLSSAPQSRHRGAIGSGGSGTAAARTGAGGENVRLPRLPPAAAAEVTPMPPPPMPVGAPGDTTGAGPSAAASDPGRTARERQQQKAHTHQVLVAAPTQFSFAAEPTMVHTAEAESAFAESWLDEVLAYSVRAHAEAAQADGRAGRGAGNSLAALLAKVLPSSSGGLTGQQREVRPDLEAARESGRQVMATPGLGGDPYASLSQGRGGGLRVFGLDRAGLEAAGIDVRSTRRLYRGLYVHGLALHRLVSGEASGVVNGGALVLRLMVGYRALLSALDADGGGGGSGEFAPRRNAAVSGRTDTEAEVNPGDLLAGMEYAAGEQERALADRGAWDLRMQLMQKAVQAERTKLKKANSEHGETRAVVRDLEAELESSQVDVAHERAISRRLREEAERVKQRYTDSLDEWKGRFESEKLAHQGRQQQLQANLEAHGKLERRHHQLESLLAAKKAEAAQLEDANNALEREVKLRDVRLEEQRKAYARDMQSLSQMKSSFSAVEEQRDAARELFDEETTKTAALNASLEDMINLSQRQAEEITQLKATVSANDRRIDACTETNRAQLKRIEGLEADLHAKEQLQERLQYAMDMNSSMRKRLEQATMSLNEVESEACVRVLALSKAMEDLRGNKGELEDTLVRAQKKMDDGRDANEKLMDDIASKSEHIADLHRQLELASNAMAKAEAAADDFNGKLLFERKRVEKLESELETTTTELNETRRANNALVENEEATAKANEESAKEKEVLIEELNEKLEQANNQNRRDEEELLDLRPRCKELLRLVGSHRELKEKQAATVNELEEMRERAVDADKRIEQRRIEHDADLVKIGELETRAAHLDAALEDEQIHRGNERKRAEELKDRLEALTAAYEKLCEEHQDLISQHDQTTADHAYEEERGRNLTGKVERLEEELEQTRLQCQELATQREACEGELNARAKANQEINALLQRNLEDLRTEREEHAACNARLVERLDHLWQQVGEDLKDKASFAQQYAELNSMVADMKSSIEFGSKKQAATAELLDVGIRRLQQELDNNRKAVAEANEARMKAAEREAQRATKRIARRRAASLPGRPPERSRRFATAGEARMHRLEAQLENEIERREEAEERADGSEENLARVRKELAAVRASLENGANDLKGLQADLQISRAAHEDEVAGLHKRIEAEVAARKWREKYAADVSDKLADTKRALQSLGARRTVSTRTTQTQYADIWKGNAMDNNVGAGRMQEFRARWLQRVADVQEGAQRVMPAQTLMSTITELYAEKVRHDAASQRQGKDPTELPELTHNFFFKRYGLPEPTEAHLSEFVASILAHQDIDEVKAFGLACGVLSEGGVTGDPLEQPGASKVLSTRGSGATSNRSPAEEDEDGDGDDAQGAALVRSQLRHASIVRDTRLLGLNAADLAHPLACNLVERVSKVMPSSLTLEELQHPLVDEANIALLATAGVDGLLRRIAADNAGAFRERELPSVDLGVMVQEEQLPQLHVLLREAAELLHLPAAQVPQLHIKESPRPRAFLWDVVGRPPSIVLTSSLVDLLSPAQIQAVVASQMALLGNARLRPYAMAKAVADWRPRLSCLDASTAPAVRHALERWGRFAQLTGDRGALVVAQDVETVVGAAVKVAAGAHTLCNELNVGVLLEQARQMDRAATLRGDRLDKLLSEGGTSAGAFARSVVVLRARELARWSQSEQLRELFGSGEQYARSERFVSSWT